MRTHTGKKASVQNTKHKIKQIQMDCFTYFFFVISVDLFCFLFYLFLSFSLSFFMRWFFLPLFAKLMAALFFGNSAIFHHIQKFGSPTAHIVITSIRNIHKHTHLHTRRICCEITRHTTRRKASNWCHAVQQPNFHHFNCFTWKIIRRPHERRCQIW